MSDDTKSQIKFSNFLSQWNEIQKKNVLILTITMKDYKKGWKVFLTQLESPRSYSEANSLYEKFKLIRGYQLKIIDEKMDDEEYIQLHTIICTISKIQGISLLDSFAYLMQIYLITIDFSRSLNNGTLFTQEIRELMNKGLCRKMKPFIQIAKIVKLWQEFGSIFLEGIFYHKDKFRIHPIYTTIPPTWLTDSEYKNEKNDTTSIIKKPIYIGSEFYAEIKQKIPQIEDKLKSAYDLDLFSKADSDLDLSARNQNHPYMNIQECAEYLRMSINKLYKLTSKKKIPHSKPGKTIIFRKEDIDKWLDSPKRKISTNEELEEQLSTKHSIQGKRSAKRIKK